MPPFTLRQLEYICAIAREGSIAQAARSLNISQPSVAQALDKLEETTGLVLFERHHARGLTPTMQGRRFLESASALLAHAARVEHEGAALAAHAAGEVRLGCFSTIAAFCLPGLIRAFASRHPDIRVTAVEATLDALAPRVRTRELDACLTYRIGDTLGGLDCHEMMTIRPTVILSSDHPCARQARLTLADLADDPYVLYDAPGSREYFTDLLDSVGLSPRIGYSSQSLESVRSAVAAGFGFSIAAFRPPYETTYEGRSLVTKPIADALPELKVVLALRPAERGDPLIEKLVDCARLYFDEGHGAGD